MSTTFPAPSAASPGSPRPGPGHVDLRRIDHSPRAYATNTSRTASTTRSGDTAASTCAALKTGTVAGNPSAGTSTAEMEIQPGIVVDGLHVERNGTLVFDQLSLSVARAA